MRFIYNGVDYVPSFYKERITLVVRQGRPLLHDITTCYTYLTAIMKKMPKEKVSIRVYGSCTGIFVQPQLWQRILILFAEEHPPLP